MCELERLDRGASYFLIVAGIVMGIVGVGFCNNADAQNSTQRELPPVSTPLPDPDMAPIIKDLHLTEGRQPVSEMIKGWRKPKKIVVWPDNNTNRIAWLQEVAPGVKLVAVHSRQDLARELADADGQIGDICRKEYVAAAGPDFHWIHDHHVGMEACFGADVPAKLQVGGSVVVTNTQRVFSSAVATHAFALMLALGRGIDLYARMNPSGHFAPVPYERLWEFEGRTLLIAGLGGIGSQMAKMGHDLGMHVIATNGSIPPTVPDYVEHVGLPGELVDMIRKADVVMSALPQTPQTINLFNASLFANMKKGAMFINVARGSQVVQADLIAALKSGQVGAAGLDVTEPNRLPENDLLFSAPNILITPHMAAQAIDAANGTGGEATWDVARENLRRYVNGDKLLSVVDPTRGY
jgi:phosphoglycerate dehydrogenase-like enzyme